MAQEPFLSPYKQKAWEATHCPQRRVKNHKRYQARRKVIFIGFRRPDAIVSSCKFLHFHQVSSEIFRVQDIRAFSPLFTDMGITSGKGPDIRWLSSTKLYPLVLKITFVHVNLVEFFLMYLIKRQVHRRLLASSHRWDFSDSQQARHKVSFRAFWGTPPVCFACNTFINVENTRPLLQNLM